jgi:type IV pilus assembly protein PilC
MPIEIKQHTVSKSGSQPEASSESLIDRLTSLLNKDIELFSKAFGDKEREAFYGKLHTLLGAGVDIKTALDLVEQAQEKDKRKQVIARLRDGVLEGKYIWQAMQVGGDFPPFEYYSIRIGEETGKLLDVLSDLATFFKDSISQRRKLIGALTYPIVVLSTAAAAIVFMLEFLVPMFADIYKRFGGDLPFVTKMVLNASKGLGSLLWVIVPLILLAGLLIYRFKEHERYRAFTAAFLAKVPVFGELVIKAYLARFCSTMALLISADIPLVQAFEMIGKMIRFYPLEKASAPIQKMLIGGSNLHVSMEKHSVFPKEMVHMIKVGEEVNQLDKMFLRLSEQYSREVAHRTEILNSLIEPLLIIVLGLVIGFILIAMYLPIFQLSTQMSV